MALYSATKQHIGNQYKLGSEWEAPAGMGGDLGGEVGGRPMHMAPNISRSSVIECVAKYELTLKRCHGEIFCSEI